MPIYLSFPGGCGALAAETIKKVKAIYMEDLGIPEAEGVFDLIEFGPVLVTLDVRGKSLYA